MKTQTLLLLGLGGAAAWFAYKYYSTTHAVAVVGSTGQLQNAYDAAAAAHNANIAARQVMPPAPADYHGMQQRAKIYAYGGDTGGNVG